MSTKKKLKKQLLSIKPAIGHCVDCGRDRAGTYVTRSINGVDEAVWVCTACDRHHNKPNRKPRLKKAEHIKARRAAANP